MSTLRFFLLGYGLGTAAGVWAGLQYGPLAGGLTAWLGGSMLSLLIAWAWHSGLPGGGLAGRRRAGTLTTAPVLAAFRAEIVRAGGWERPEMPGSRLKPAPAGEQRKSAGAVRGRSRHPAPAFRIRAS